MMMMMVVVMMMMMIMLIIIATTSSGNSKMFAPKDTKMAKSSGNWLNPTPISNRFSSQQEDDLVNQSSPGREDTPKPPPI
jgi:hypothetical protein